MPLGFLSYANLMQLLYLLIPFKYSYLRQYGELRPCQLCTEFRFLVCELIKYIVYCAEFL